MTTMSQPTAFNRSETQEAGSSHTMEDQLNLIIFSLLLLTSLLLARILELYNQQRPDSQLNVLVLLQTHLTSVLPAINLNIILPVLVRLAAGPLSTAVAELTIMLLYVLVSLVVVLTVASSIIKLLLVRVE